MTANQVKGKGFRGALRYNLEKLEKGVAEVLDHSFAVFTEKSIMKEIEMIRSSRPNLQKFFYHTSINFPKGERLTNEAMKQIAIDYLCKCGFTQNQFLVFRHFDASHPHMHILVNRIGYDGQVLTDSNDFNRSEKVLRALEVKYNLTQVESSKQARKRAPTKNELEMAKRLKQPSHKQQLQNIIEEALKSDKKITCPEFIASLVRKSVRPKFNIASTGYVSGISYQYKGMVISGAKLGGDFKWTTLKNVIDYDQHRDEFFIRRINFSSLKVNIPQAVNSISTKSEHSQMSYSSQGTGEASLNSLVKVDTPVESYGNFSEEKRKKKRRKGKSQ